MTAATSITVRVPLAIRHRPGRKTVVTPMTDGVAPLTTRADPALVKALARAFRYQRLLEEGRHASVTDIAAAERIDRGYLGRILQLTLLAPELVEGILDGSIAPGDGFRSIGRAASLVWDQQREMFCSAPRRSSVHTSSRLLKKVAIVGCKAAPLVRESSSIDHIVVPWRVIGAVYG